MSVRGVRNNNPGNLRNTDTPWEGLATLDEMTDEQLGESEFEVFRKPWWGIRAIAKTFLTYQQKYGLKTIAQLIDRYAPDNENPTSKYINFVCMRVGRGPDKVIDLTDFEILYPLVKAICHFENGLTDETDPYTWEYIAGLILAGVEP